MAANLFVKLLRVVVGLAFVFFGALKFIRPEVHADYFTIFPDFLMPLTGVAEATLGIALLVGFQIRWAAYALALIMGGALFSHIVVGLDGRVVPVIVLGLLCLVLGYGARPSSRSTVAIPPQGK